MSVPVLTIVGNALKGHNVYAPGEPIKHADAQDVLSALNQILDDWNADGQASIAEVFTTFATTPSLQPHTIGPTGVWVLPVRPVTIDGAALESSPGIWTPIGVHLDPHWWLEQTLVTGASVSDLYYAPTVPNGEIYFTGVPGSALNVTLMTRTTLAAVLLTQSLTLAPGYESALTLTLMEAIADLFHATASASLATRAGKARARIWKNNLRIPSLSAAGLGLPGMQGGRFDARTGTWS
jgi:hypothetical protein